METVGFGREIALGDAGTEVKAFNREDTENCETRGHRDEAAARGFCLMWDQIEERPSRHL